jgi:hypothetical protein
MCARHAITMLVIAGCACGGLVLPRKPHARRVAIPSASPSLRVALPSHAIAPQVMALRAMRSPLPQMTAGDVARSLWPTTLGKFWGLHALGWCTAACAVAVLSSTRRALMLPAAAAAMVAGANLALALLLYRDQADAGIGLAAAATLYFTGCAAFLHGAVLQATIGPLQLLVSSSPLAHSLAALLARAVAPARAWHCGMAIGSAMFGIKASLKDRLFLQASAASTTESGPTLAVPTLAMINSKSGAKVGLRVADGLNELARRWGDDKLRVVDLAQQVGSSAAWSSDQVPMENSPTEKSTLAHPTGNDHPETSTHRGSPHTPLEWSQRPFC